MTDKEKNLGKVDESIDKSKFEFVQKEEKIYDKKFQTKPIGYFKDAMIRFAKNKTNVFATVVLSLLILFSIVIPSIDPKAEPIANDQIDSQISHLPPRIPWLEKLGIADGTASYEDVPASYDNPYIDEEGNPILDSEGNVLYLPTGEFSEFIEPNSLSNYTLSCTDREETCEGGTVQWSKQYRTKPVAAYVTQREITTNVEGLEEEVFTRMTLGSIFSPSEVLISVNIDENNPLNENILDGTAAFKVYFQIQDEDATSVNDLQMILVFDSSDASTYDNYDAATGLYTVDIKDNENLGFNTEKYRVVLSYESDTLDSAVLDYFSISARSGNFIYGEQSPEDSPEDKYLVYDQGFELSKYSLATDFTDIVDGTPVLRYGGNILRIGGQRLNASYTVDAYSRAFGPVFRFLEGSTFQEYMSTCTYEDGTPFDIDAFNAKILANPQNPNVSEFYGRMGENCPIYEFLAINDTVVIIDQTTGQPTGDVKASYDVYLNYRVVADYDELPYYFFGTSAAGYDMFNLVWIGLRTSLLIGLFVSAINIAIGIVYGAISGYYGGQVDIIMQRFAEIIGRIPWLVTLSIFMAYFEAGFTSLILILIVTGWIGVSAVTRTQFYRYKGREYVLASRTLGAKDGRLIFRHILPNGIGTIITSSILLIPTVIFSEATLSYLGFGIGHGQSFKLFGIEALELSGVSIGVLLNDGRNKLQNFPHLTIFPAIIISILMITFNMFGNALRDAFNPALRGSE